MKTDCNVLCNNVHNEHNVHTPVSRFTCDACTNAHDWGGEGGGGVNV